MKLQVSVFWMGFKWHSVAWNMLILITKPWKNLVFIFFYNKNPEQDKHFREHIVKIENILKLWCMWQLTLEGRITVFNSLAASNFIHLLLITKLHNNTIDLLYKIQKKFIWQEKKAKVKHSTLCNGYEKGDIKRITRSLYMILEIKNKDHKYLVKY